MHGPLLDKRRTIAHAGFSRWLVPCAALAVHLSIGMAYGFSVFWLPLSRAVGLARPAPCPAGTTVLQELTATHCDWRVSTLGWTYTLFFVCLGSSAAVFGPWLEARGAAQGRRHRGGLLGGGPRRRARRVRPPDLAPLARRGRPRRRRARPRLPVARLHAHQVVPRPARHGDGDGHHGLRRRRHDRLAPRRPAHEALRHADLRGRRRDLRHARRRVLRRDDGGRDGLPAPAAGVAAARRGDAGRAEGDGDARPRPRAGRPSHAAVLAPVGRPLPQRQRRDRHPRHGLPDASRGVRRARCWGCARAPRSTRGSGPSSPPWPRPSPGS